jgi:alpha-D-ribose 1-methylphosphonate 5-triphosphate synthase subunit PhnH
VTASPTLLPGFAAPGRDAQRTFRAVLDAMARPGAIRQTATPSGVPAPLCAAAAALLLTLADEDAPVWLDTWAAPSAGWIAFHCGTNPIAEPASAALAIARAMPPLDKLPAGDDEQPQDGATLILQVDALGAGAPYRLTGPGIETDATLAVTGLPPEFPTIWDANRARFPRGVDLILCAGDRVAALPRTTKVEAV